MILDTAKSLDGSHQWQGLSLPMPRARGGAINSNVGAGYPARKASGFEARVDRSVKKRFGFPYYQSIALRRDVFAKLFPMPFEGEILKRKEYDVSRYPFRPCDHDPFRPTHTEGSREKVCETLND